MKVRASVKKICRNCKKGLFVLFARIHGTSSDKASFTSLAPIF